MKDRKKLYKVAYIFQIISCVINLRYILLTYSLFISVYSIALNVYSVNLGFVIVLLAFCFIQLAWMIPMTIATKNAMNEVTPKNHLALGICTLLFQSLIAGIFILVANGTRVNPVEEEFNDENRRNDLDYI
ncbi:hypothetical protein [Spiroplasma endosymbiont of Labia minor]|uniref:hypothetical protein n=1 Tax=Spiroplasma endosymbiont of Labia minor TaxID=3066305 RepID=UPI0030D045FA